MEVGNRSVIRKVNQRAILDYIIQSGGASRAEIAKALGLSKPAASENVIGLLENNVISEYGVVESNVGKKGTMLKFNDDLLFVLVVDITGQLYEKCIPISVCDLSYRVLFKISVSVDEQADEIQIAERIEKAIYEHHINLKYVKVIVASVSGIIKDGAQQHMFPQNKSPKEIRSLISRFFEKEILVFNDVNLAAIGERAFGGGLAKENMAYLWVDLAIGAGILIKGELYEGTFGAAGEISFLKTAVMENNELRYHFLHEVASIGAVEKRLNEEYEQSKYLTSCKSRKSKIDFADLVGGRNAKDAYCVSLCEFLYRCVAEAVFALAVPLDLDTLIIGGRINLLGDELFGYINAYIKDVAFVKTQINKPSRKDASLWGGYYMGVQRVIDTLV